MSKASKTRTHPKKPVHNSHAKSPAAARHVVSPGDKPRKLVKRTRTTPATPSDELPNFVLIAEEDYFELPEDEFDDDVDELNE